MLNLEMRDILNIYVTVYLHIYTVVVFLCEDSPHNTLTSS